MKTEDIGALVAGAANKKKTAADHFDPDPVISPELLSLSREKTSEKTEEKVTPKATPEVDEGRANISVFGPAGQIRRIREFKDRRGGTYAQMVDDLISSVEKIEDAIPSRMSLTDGIKEMLEVYEILDQLAAEQRSSPVEILKKLLEK